VNAKKNKVGTKDVPGESIKSATVLPVMDFTWAKVKQNGYNYSIFVLDVARRFNRSIYRSLRLLQRVIFGQPSWLVPRKCKLVFACFWAQ
jgi:hypothetical protein